MDNSLIVGYEISKVFKVKKDDTAKVVGSGGLPVLATPVLACWIEQTAYGLLELNLKSGETSVGTRLELNHISPSPVDMKVTVTVCVKDVDRRRVVFSFTASDACQEIANGLHERVVVDQKKFMTKVLEKKDGSGK